MPKTEPAVVIVYTDGACDPNPGPGGWAAVLRFGTYEKEIHGGEPATTNNRMELRATIEALAELTRPCHVKIHTDSEYLQKGVTEWLPRWQTDNWRTRRKRPVANQDLWRKLNTMMKPHSIRWHWIKGHSGHPLNERADSLARAAITRTEFRQTATQAFHMFTGASCTGPHGPGGWAVVMRHGNDVSTLSGRETNTTANRLQLLAAIRALNYAQGEQQIHLYTPSDYVQRGATLWIHAWRRRNWKTRGGQPVKNSDLWQDIVAACTANEVHWHLHKTGDHAPETTQAHKLAYDEAASTHK